MSGELNPNFRVENAHYHMNQIKQMNTANAKSPNSVNLSEALGSFLETAQLTSRRVSIKWPSARWLNDRILEISFLEIF